MSERDDERPKQHLGSCSEACDRFGVVAECCDSCHYEDEEGYNAMGELYRNDGRYSVCCCVRSALHDKGIANEW